MADIEKKLSEQELEQINGGWSEEEERRERERKEQAMRGSLSIDAMGNRIFTDKSGNVGTFTAQEWNTLAQNWAYTGNPEWWMRTLDVNELKGML
jgi:bacteriocin-like protein